MKSLTLLRALVILGAMAASPSFAEIPQAQIEVRESLEIMKAHYRAKLDAPTEIELACVGEVYSTWFKAYEPIVKQVVPESLVSFASYQDALNLANLHEKDMATLYPRLRKKLPEATLQILAKVRRESPDISIPGPLAPDEIFENNFSNALNACSTAYYVTQVKSLAPTVKSLDLELRARLDEIRMR